MNDLGDPQRWKIAPQLSLPHMVADRVREAIRNGTLQPGQRIVEADLAAKLGVSRGSLREALKALEAEHLIEHRRSRGTFVASASEADAVKMTAVRVAVEGMAARLVAGEGRPEVLRELEAIHLQMEDDARDGRVELWRDRNWEFHEAVCRASGNEFLIRAWSSISNLVRMFYRAHPSHEHNPREVLESHDEMIGSLKSGDPTRAERTFQLVILRSVKSQLDLALPPGLIGLLQPA